MTGIQLSVNWAVAQAAETLAASSKQDEREAGRSLRCCEVYGLDRLSQAQREPNTQGVRVSLRFYLEADQAAVDVARGKVASAIAQAMGLWRGAVQLDIESLPDDGRWLGIRRPSKPGGTGLRLDRYLTAEVLERLESKRGNKDWTYLAERPTEVRILLRRLRYRLIEDYGSEESSPRYAYWTTAMTEEWAQQGGHLLDYLVSRLSGWSRDLHPGSADPASSLDASYWGEVDTEQDPLRVKQLTTANGTTGGDVQAVLAYAGAQIRHVAPLKISATTSVNTADPLAPFVKGLNGLHSRPEDLQDVDVLLVHRGGGVNPTSKRKLTNVPDDRKRELFELCTKVRDLGVEVVVALGHANISVLKPLGSRDVKLPLGIFEATTPTAGAAWILQEHINPRLVDRGLIYSQPRES